MPEQDFFHSRIENLEMGSSYFFLYKYIKAEYICSKAKYVIDSDLVLRMQ